ncbi:unnamed protein product [Meloidogyne enterolobii]|uniref:Uncharacterized protein n=1 Tax=Meloidogyne enterolobii TaxID=390850 RepID=A0ACB1A4Q4_MELEN
MTISQLYKKVLSSSYNFKLVPRSTLRTFERMRIDPNTPKIKLNNAATPETTATNNLPKLPVPQLEHTIEKFLKFCKPILGPEDYGETLKESIEAKQLQKMLERRAQKLDNWVCLVYFRLSRLIYGQGCASFAFRLSRIFAFFGLSRFAFRFLKSVSAHP